MQLVAGAISDALERAWGAPVLVHRASPVVTIHANYEVLGYPAGAPAREARYTRYLDERRLLRHAHDRGGPRGAPPPRPARQRRRRRRGMPRPGLPPRRGRSAPRRRAAPARPVARAPRRAAHHRRSGRDDRPRRLGDPARRTRHRALPASHPYTTEGREVEVEVDGGWVELLECGLAGAHVARGGRARSRGVVGARAGPRPRPRTHAAKGRRRHPPPALVRSPGRRADARPRALPRGERDAADPARPLDRRRRRPDRRGAGRPDPRAGRARCARRGGGDGGRRRDAGGRAPAAGRRAHRPAARAEERARPARPAPPHPDAHRRGGQPHRGTPSTPPSTRAARTSGRDQASAAFLGSLPPPSELFFSDFSDDLESLDPSDLPSEPAFLRRP